MAASPSAYFMCCTYAYNWTPPNFGTTTVTRAHPRASLPRTRGAYFAVSLSSRASGHLSLPAQHRARGAPMLLTGLGDDEISFISKYLSIRHLMQARQVCKRFTWSVLLGCYGNSTGITFIENLLHFFIVDRAQVAATVYSAEEAMACCGGPGHSVLTGAQGVAAAQRLLPVLFAMPRGVQVLLLLRLLSSTCSPLPALLRLLSPPALLRLLSPLRLLSCSPPPALPRLLSSACSPSACSPPPALLLSSACSPQMTVEFHRPRTTVGYTLRVSGESYSYGMVSQDWVSPARLPHTHPTLLERNDPILHKHDTQIICDGIFFLRLAKVRDVAAFLPIAKQMHNWKHRVEAVQPSSPFYTFITNMARGSTEGAIMDVSLVYHPMATNCGQSILSQRAGFDWLRLMWGGPPMSSGRRALLRLLSSAYSPPPARLLSSACSPLRLLSSPPALLRLLSFACSPPPALLRLLSSACSPSPALLRLLSPACSPSPALLRLLSSACSPPPALLSACSPSPALFRLSGSCVRHVRQWSTP